MKTTSLLFAAVPGALALDIPSNVKTFYDGLKAKGKCDKALATGFYNSQFEQGDMSYCGDHLDDYGVVYLQGPGKFSNMDVDCDGAPNMSNGDTRCEGGAGTTVYATAIQPIIAGYNIGINDINTFDHSFVVFGNTGKPEEWPTFDPRTYGVSKASVMAVVCGDKMFYGVWGDTNGPGVRPSVGEVSLSLATACYGQSMSGGSETGSSHDDPDVLYIAFTGTDAVPGATGADWTADNFDDFHNSIVSLGDKLVKRIGGNNTGDGDDNTCTWAGHCLGASCATAQDCSDDFICTDGKCTTKST
ncbi:unnamed protein product [Clonostachys rosea f. rosea IK726]|uniref:Endo-chitosanase n=2 Tax=Bionectria ochroleuca TaxID=29856 RepID=A0A0B7K3N1_BIOOC|nr:unnamed protein product [Clonostachys rosea f. rosea IK726]